MIKLRCSQSLSVFGKCILVDHYIPNSSKYRFSNNINAQILKGKKKASFSDSTKIFLFKSVETKISGKTSVHDIDNMFWL